MIKKALSILFVMILVLSLAGCGTKAPQPETEDSGSKATEAPVDYGKSGIYTKEDMDAAIREIQKEFDNWRGCTMSSIRYDSDTCNSQKNIKWINELKENKNYTQCIQFYTNFHSPTEEKDLEGTAWEPDMEYKDYQWTLGREEGGSWELITWGYE